eukprot:scaffold13_cov241-Pinguiococcus_pyrenoidosus.AAC.20
MICAAAAQPRMSPENAGSTYKALVYLLMVGTQMYKLVLNRKKLMRFSHTAVESFTRGGPLARSSSASPSCLLCSKPAQGSGSNSSARDDKNSEKRTEGLRQHFLVLLALSSEAFQAIQQRAQAVVTRQVEQVRAGGGHEVRRRQRAFVVLLHDLAHCQGVQLQKLDETQQFLAQIRCAFAAATARLQHASRELSLPLQEEQAHFLHGIPQRLRENRG